MADRKPKEPMSQFELLALIEKARIERWERLDLDYKGISVLPPEIGSLIDLHSLRLVHNELTELPESIGGLTNLRVLELTGNKLNALPEAIGWLSNLVALNVQGNQLTAFPPHIGTLKNLQLLFLNSNRLAVLPDFFGNLSSLTDLDLSYNGLTTLPPSLARLNKLRRLDVVGNPLNPALLSASKQGLSAVQAYLRSLDEAEPLYEAKLVLVGEGGVGKTTLLKALSGREPRKGEPTTHGISIDIQSMHLPHPEKDGVTIQFNGWDFGGQEIYRVTHQFFFSRRSVYLLVWEPRLGVQQSQVEDWLTLIRLRVGDDARVIIVSTHAKTGQRIARIDKPVFLRDYGSMIVEFVEVDSLEDDPETGEQFGMASLKTLIALAAKDLEQMGMPFNVHWKAARDELIAKGENCPRISFNDFGEVCARHGLDEIDSRTLAGLMHDLGYIVYYGVDERLKDDVVLQPEWLTKAIGFVLEDRGTQEREGVLPDSRLDEVWLEHSFTGEPRYEPALYPFFLRLMEKYDVAYRLEDGTASLVAQHVPQVRPSLPWLPEEEPRPEMRRLAMVCVMEESPPGLVPWMIVRTHEYAVEREGHRLHWQKGMFLRNRRHGEAMLELRGREFHLHTEAVWPEYFMNVLRQTLSKLISDNWPGMQGRYSFTVPCRQKVGGEMCPGRFNIESLRQFLDEGDDTIRCQECRTRQEIVELLYGFEEEEPREQLARIEGKLEHGFEVLASQITGLESRLANAVMALMRAMADEAREGPRLFDIEPESGNWRRIFGARYRLRLWCEAQGCQHPVREPGKGIYGFTAPREWVVRVAPYARLVVGLLRTITPMVAPGVDVIFGEDTIKNSGIESHLELMKEFADKLPGGAGTGDERSWQGVLSEDERSGLLALHAMLRELDPQHANLGLHRIPTYTGDYLWLCQKHYELSQPKIPDVIAGNS